MIVYVFVYTYTKKRQEKYRKENQLNEQFY